MSKGTKLLGRLPSSQAKLALVSGEYPELADSLRRLGIDAILTTADIRLSGPVQWHPDMQACAVGGRMIALKDCGLLDELAKYGIPATETMDIPESSYPKDVLCNVLTCDKWVLGNAATADKAITEATDSLGLTWINVKQGYAACATALVDEQSAITADNGVALRLEHHGIQVLRIGSGAVRLPGYPYGFIGGCCGKLSSERMAFTGSLDSHPDGDRIRKFLSMRGIVPVELFHGELLDVGGLIALY